MSATKKSDLLNDLIALSDDLRRAQERTIVARQGYEAALDEERDIETRFNATRATIERALVEQARPAEPKKPLAAKPPAPKRPPAPSMPPLPKPPVDEDAADDDASDGVRPSFMELIRRFPVEGDVGMPDLRAWFAGMNDGALNGRLAKCKKRGLIESAAWGRYRLTEAGRKVQTQRLQLVGGN